MFPCKDDEGAVRVRASGFDLPPPLSRIHPDRWALQHPGYDFTVYTQVLSIIGLVPGTCNLPLLRHAFPNLLVLRLSPELPSMNYLPYVPFGARTLVFFSSRPRDRNGDYSSRRTSTEEAIRPGTYNFVWRWTARHKKLYPEDYPRSLSPMVERIVLHTWNLHCVPDLASMYSLPRTLSPHLREIVIVVPVYMGLELIPTFFKEWNLAEAARNLAPILNIPHVTYTIVGLEVIKVENHESKFKAALREALLKRGRACQDSQHTQTKSDAALHTAKVTETMTRVRTMTFDAYVASSISPVIVIGELQALPPWEMEWVGNDGEMEENPWDFLETYPEHTEVDEGSCSADRLFDYISQNGLL